MVAKHSPTVQSKDPEHSLFCRIQRMQAVRLSAQPTVANSKCHVITVTYKRDRAERPRCSNPRRAVAAGTLRVRSALLALHTTQRPQAVRSASTASASAAIIHGRHGRTVGSVHTDPVHSPLPHCAPVEHAPPCPTDRHTHHGISSNVAIAVFALHTTKYASRRTVASLHVLVASSAS